MKKTIEVTIVIEVEATNQDVLDEGLFDLHLDAQSNTEGFRVLDFEILSMDNVTNCSY